MKYYKIGYTDESGQWRVRLTNEEDNRQNFFLYNERTVKSFWKLEDSLELLLWFQDYQDASYQNLGFSDIIRWVGSIMHDPPLRGAPISKYLVIREQIKKYFETLNIPNHRFHQLIIKKEDDGEARRYFGFQIVHNLYDSLDYQNTAFKVIENNEDVRKFDTGEYSSFEQLKQLHKTLGKNQTIKPSELKLSKEFDVFCNFETEFLVSENVRNHILDMNIKGIKFTELNRYSIL